MKKLVYLIVLTLILGLVLTGCLLSNVGQVPTTEQSGIVYLTKALPLHDNLVGLWHFSGNADDSSGEGNDGTVFGATYVDSPMGEALSFDGNDYVIVPDDDTLDITDEITIEAWINPTAVGGYRTIVSKRSGSVANYTLRLWGGKVEFYYRRVGATQWSEWCTTVAPVSAGNPYHIAVTYTFDQGASIKVYVEGTSYNGSWIYGVSQDITENTFPVYIGYNYSGYPQPFQGTIDEVRIWNVALPEDQLGFIYEFGGILPPIKEDGSSVFKLGRTIPVKFQLRDDQGNFVTDAVANIFVKKTGNGTSGEIEAVSTAAATTGNLFRYDFSSNQYIFNLSTKLPFNNDENWSTGTWEIRIELDDGMSYCVEIGLK